MNRVELAGSLVKMAKELLSASVFFSDLEIGDTFHKGIWKGKSGDIQVTFYKKLSPSVAEIVKSDWAPGTIGNKEKMSAKFRTFPMKVPSHDTRR